VTTQIKAIETRYAGCRFRSRLEARWAVFFDTLGMKWQYEPQGYAVGAHDEHPYLPDFWLPDLALWVEVKGELGHEDLTKLVWAAARTGLPANLAGDRLRPGDECFYRPRLLVLGEIPTPGTGYLHSRFDIVGDLVMLARAHFTAAVNSRDDVTWKTEAIGEPAPLNQYLVVDTSTESERQRIVAGRQYPLQHQWPHVRRAYEAARSARFEHGENPSTFNGTTR
jgi:hypothetical protein